MRLAFGLLMAGIAVAYKVAVFAPYLSNSQLLFNKRVAEVLADAGHDVRLYVLYMIEHNYTMIEIQPNVKYEFVNASSGSKAQSLFDDNVAAFFDSTADWGSRPRALMEVLDLIAGSCELLITNATFLDGVRAEKFDVAITHMFSYCGIGVTKLTGIPSWIWASSGLLLEHISSAVGVPKPPSYCSPVMMDAGDNMAFLERVKSFVGHAISQRALPMLVGDKETAIFRRHFGDDFPSLTELAKAAPVVFVNSNELYDFACPTLHKIVNIGGLGMQEAKSEKELDQEYGSLVKSAVDGHIVMTFGSFAPMYLMPAHWKDAFLRTFEAFPNVQFFLRYEKDDLNDRLPRNVHLSKWLPQAALLMHPKCRGLITHGGYNSVQDSIYASVPMIVIALFGDQYTNAHLVEKLGIGVSLRKESITADTVHDAIRRLIEDQRFKSAAVRLQSQVRKKPISPDQLLVRWTEFVAEFQTLENLVPFGNKLGFVQYHSLDVIAFLVGILILLASLLLLILRCALGCITKRCHSTKVKLN